MSVFICLIGKSASGKSAIAKYFAENIAFTTREPRVGEIDGKDYFFKDKDFIKEEIRKYEANESDYILEWGEYDGHYYGTLKSEFDNKMSQSDIVVNVMEIEGALTMKRKLGSDLVKLVWVETAEFIRRRRLMDRAQKNGKDMNSRIDESHRDRERDLCDYMIFNNSSIEKAVNDLREYTLMYQDDNKMEAIMAIDRLEILGMSKTLLSYYKACIIHSHYNGMQSDIQNLQFNIKGVEGEQKKLLQVVKDYLESVYVMKTLEENHEEE